MSDDAWDWSHNGVGGAPAWNWEGAPTGVDPLRLPKSPLPERRALAEKVEADARKRQFLAAHGWTAHSDPETGYEFWQHAKSGATQWEPPDVREVVEQARRERSGEARPEEEEEEDDKQEATTHTLELGEPPASAKLHRGASSPKIHMMNAREWAKFQEEERALERRAKELEAARLAKIQARKDFLHERRRLSLDIPSIALAQALRRLYERGCSTVTYPGGDQHSYRATETSLGFSFVRRRKGGVMIAWTTPGSNTLANCAGLRRGMHFLEVNGQDVAEAPTPQSAMLAIARAGFPATLLFRPAPDDADELFSFLFLVCRAQKNFRKRLAYRKRVGSIVMQTIARGYIAKMVAHRRRILRNKAAAATVIQSRIRARLARDYGRRAQAQARAPASSVSGWHVCNDWNAIGGATFYVHEMRLERIEWTPPPEIAFPVWEKRWDSQEARWYFFNTRTLTSQWERPHDYFDHDADSTIDVDTEHAPPDGLLLLRAAETVQRAYRRRRARFRLQRMRRLRGLEKELNVGSLSDRHTSNNGSEWMQRFCKWEELANLRFDMGMWDSAAAALVEATDNFAARSAAASRAKRRAKRIAEKKARRDDEDFAGGGGFGGGRPRKKAFQLKGNSRTSTRISAPPGVEVDTCMRRLAVCMHKAWEARHDPKDLNAATDALESAFKFSKNMNNPELLLVSARCHAAAGSIESALKILSRLITLVPYWDKIDAAVFFAAALLKAAGKYNESRAYFQWVQDSPFVVRRRVRPYLISFQMAHIYQLEAFRDETLGRHAASRENSELAISGFQASYKLHPTLGSHRVGMPSPDKVREWLSRPETWQELGMPLSEAGCPILAAECVSESFKRKTPQEQQDPKEWYRVAMAAAESGDLSAATAWAKGALDREPFLDNFSEKVRAHMLAWDDEACRPGSDDDEHSEDEVGDGARERDPRMSPARKEKNRLDGHARVLQIWSRHCLQTIRILAPLRRLARWSNPTKEDLAAVLRCQVAFRRKHGGLAKHMKMQARKFEAEELKRKHEAALRLQAAWRKKKGTYASFILGRAKKVAQDREDRLERAAFRVQCAWRKKKGTFAKHMLKAARRDVERDAQRERERLERERLKRWNAAARVIQKWFRNRFFSQMMNLVSAAIEQKRVYDRIVLTQATFRGVRTRKWMARRHELATLTAAAFRGYMVRLGARLRQRLRQQVAGRKINRFLKESLRIRERDFLMRDDSALKIQRLLRGFLVRWRAHAQFKTAVHLWGIEVLRNRRGPIPVTPGPETERANRDGELLANTIWCRYPCPNPGALFGAAGAPEFMALMPGAAKKKADDRIRRNQRSARRKRTRTKRTVWGMPSVLREEQDNELKMPVLPGGRGALLPTYLNSTVPSFMLSKAVRVTPAGTLPSIHGQKDDMSGRWAVPRERADAESVRRRLKRERTKPEGGLVWRKDFAVSLKKDVQAMVRTRKEDWARRHDQSRWSKKRAKRLRDSERMLHQMVERQKREREAGQRPSSTPARKRKTTSIFG